MIQIHHLNNSRSQRVLWMMEEIGEPYEIVAYERNSFRRAPDSLRKVHALGKSPVVTDGERVIAESGAIVEYLAQHFAPHLIPEHGSSLYLQHSYWMHYAEGSAAFPFLLKFFVSLLGEDGERLMPLIVDEMTRHLEFMSQELGAKDYFLGDEVMAVDFQMIYPLQSAAVRGPLADFAALVEYVARVEDRPAYRRGIERGGPYGLGA
jgi:glutathione S-transferase